jgi:hypothetical protein
VRADNESKIAFVCEHRCIPFFDSGVAQFRKFLRGCKVKVKINRRPRGELRIYCRSIILNGLSCGDCSAPRVYQWCQNLKMHVCSCLVCLRIKRQCGRLIAMGRYGHLTFPQNPCTCSQCNPLLLLFSDSPSWLDQFL